MARYSSTAAFTFLLSILAGCGGGGSDSGGGAHVPTSTPVATATRPGPPPTPTRSAGAAVAGLILVRNSVRAEKGDALGTPPQEWMAHPDAPYFDRALSHAQLSVAGTVASTGADGSFVLAGLPPGVHVLEVTKTIDGNLVWLRVPIRVGPDGSAQVIAEMSWGQVRATSTYSDNGSTFVETVGPAGNRALTRDGQLVELSDAIRTFRDADGDGFFDVGPCFPGEVLACNRDPNVCPPSQTCRCTASCPDCEDCGPAVCTPPGAPQPYRCDGDGGCALGDHCTCASSCLGCDNCEVFVCQPDRSECPPLEIVAIDVQGPHEVIAGRTGSLFATARLSDGGAVDVTHLVTWESSNADVLGVDPWGTFEGKAVGSADVTAVLGEIRSAAFTVNVVARPALRRISVQNVSCNCYPGIYGRPELDESAVAPCYLADGTRGDLLPVPSCGQVVRIGATIQFAAIGEFGDGASYEDISDEVDWQVDPPAVGSIEAGRFSALAAGTARVSASLGEVTSDSTEVKVVAEATIVHLSIYVANWGYPVVGGGPLSADAHGAPCFECGYFLTVLRGDELRFGATAQYDTGEWEDVTARVSWRTSNASVATIDPSGVMTAVAGGDARIDAILGELSSNSVDVRVVNDATLQYLSIYPEGTDRVVPKGGQLFFRATAQYDVGFGRDVTDSVTWRSSDDSVGGFDSPGVFTGRNAGGVQIWAELQGVASERFFLEVYATSELEYCDPSSVNRDVWFDHFNRVVLESDCAHYDQPGVVTLRYTVTETQPHGGIFDPCLDLYVYDGARRVRTLREEGCGDPFLPNGAPGRDESALRYQLRAFWDLRDESGAPVADGVYTIYGRFFLYYDPVVSIDITVGDAPPRPSPTPLAGAGACFIGSSDCTGRIVADFSREQCCRYARETLSPLPASWCDEVDPATGMCAAGRCRLSPCEEPRCCPIDAICAPGVPPCEPPETCGGFTGSTCRDGEVCDLRDPSCQISDLIGRCVPAAGLCPQVFAPVCGCDGQTYPNDCERLRAGATLAHQGPCDGQCCPDSSPCIPELPPCLPTTCAGIAGLPCPEGQVCDLRDESCQTADLGGQCVPKPEICPEIYAPVCGCDGVTYPNDCERVAAGAILARPGPCDLTCCPPNARCDPSIPPCDPVCCPAHASCPSGVAPCPRTCAGIAGLACPQGQACDLRDATCQIADLGGQCVPKPEICPDLHAPVCGCDGVTYSNDCERIAAGAILAHGGSCDLTCCPPNARCEPGIPPCDPTSCCPAGVECPATVPPCPPPCCPINTTCAGDVPSCEGELRWQTDCGPPVVGVYTAEDCERLIASGRTACTDEHLHESCDTAGDTCLFRERNCNAGLMCATAPPVACPISRRAYKKDVDYLDAEDRTRLHEDLLTIKLATYRYKQEPDASTPHLGFVIEDVEPSPAVDAPRDMVDLYGYLSMAVASIQVQAEQIRALQQEIDTLRQNPDACAIDRSRTQALPIAAP